MQNMILTFNQTLSLLAHVRQEMNMTLGHARQVAENGGLLLPTGAVLVLMDNTKPRVYVVKGYAANGADLAEYREFTK